MFGGIISFILDNPLFLADVTVDEMVDAFGNESEVQEVTEVNPMVFEEEPDRLAIYFLKYYFREQNKLLRIYKKLKVN